MFVDRPHIRTPRPAKNRAVWLALFRPNTLHRRPYSGVKLHVASRYLGVLSVGGVWFEQILATHDVPSQLASLDLLNSEEIDGNTYRDK
jgi:hypothetical protein